MNIHEILESVLSGNNSKIKEAENNLKNLAELDFGKLLLDLATILSDESIIVDKRQLSASIIRNSIIEDGSSIKWLSLNHEIKELIKNNVLASLASEINDIRKSGSLAVTGIASIEIPNNLWRDIINILVVTSEHENTNFKISSIITIGYLCQEISPNYLIPLEKSALLSAILKIIETESNYEIVLNALISLQSLISHARSIHDQNTSFKNRILNAVYIHLKPDNTEILKNCLLCIIDITRHYYEYLLENIDDLVKLSQTYFFFEDENIGILIYEIWSSITDEEIIRIKHKKNLHGYADKCLLFLTSVIKYHYLNRNPQREKNNPDKWNLAKSASILLNALSRCTNIAVIDFVFELIKEHINSDNTKIKESVLMAYGSILETVHEAKIKEIIEGSLPTLINMLADKSIDVRTTVSWVIKKICRYHTDRILALEYNNKALLDEFIQALIKYLSSNKKIIINVCESINYLSINIRKLKSDSRTCCLSPYYDFIIKTLIEIAYSKDSITNDYNLALNGFFTISTLVDNSPADVIDLIGNYFGSFIVYLEKTISQKKEFDTEEHRLMYQEYICSLISSYLLENKMKLNLEQAEYLYNIVKNIFLERGTVFETGIQLCSSISLNIGKAFIEILNDYGNFLYHALTMWNIESICKTAITSVSDLIRSLGDLFEPYVDQLLPVIFGIIENVQCEKILRSRSLMIISDLFLCCKEKAQTYIEKILQIVMNAMQASVIIFDNDDNDLYEYYNTLRENLLECIVCIISNLRETNKISYLSKHIPEILKYSQTIVEEVYYPSIDIFYKCLWIISEICEIHQSDIKEYIDKPKIEYIIKNFKEMNIDKSLEEFVQYSEEVLFATLYN